jgi:hypothetical protein
MLPSSSLPAIEKLEGKSNYNNRKFAGQRCLIHENIWGCVDGTDGDPRKDKKALAKICLMLKLCTYPHVRSVSPAKEDWQNLQKVYEDKKV